MLHSLDARPETPDATIAPLWIMGPSLPMGRPAATANVTLKICGKDNTGQHSVSATLGPTKTATTLHSSVLMRRISGIFTPFSTHFKAGIPDPPGNEQQSRDADKTASLSNREAGLTRGGRD